MNQELVRSSLLVKWIAVREREESSDAMRLA